MKTLLLMRHSHAVSDNSAYSDHDRPLTEQGRHLAQQTAELTSEWGIDQIVCSSSARTIETAKEFAALHTAVDEPTSHKELYLASQNAYASAAWQFAKPATNSLLVIGHNPGIAALICDWADDYLAISPATVAVFQLAIEDWQQLNTKDDLTKELVGVVSNGARFR